MQRQLRPNKQRSQFIVVVAIFLAALLLCQLLLRETDSLSLLET